MCGTKPCCRCNVYARSVAHRRCLLPNAAGLNRTHGTHPCRLPLPQWFESNQNACSQLLPTVWVPPETGHVSKAKDHHAESVTCHMQCMCMAVQHGTSSCKSFLGNPAIRNGGGGGGAARLDAECHSGRTGQTRQVQPDQAEVACLLVLFLSCCCGRPLLNKRLQKCVTPQRGGLSWEPARIRKPKC